MKIKNFKTTQKLFYLDIDNISRTSKNNRIFVYTVSTEYVR